MYGDRYTCAVSYPVASSHLPGLAPVVATHTCDDLGFAVPVQSAGVRVAVTICVPDTSTTDGALRVKLQAAGTSAGAGPATTTAPPSARPRLTGKTARRAIMSEAYAPATP